MKKINSIIIVIAQAITIVSLSVILFNQLSVNDPDISLNKKLHAGNDYVYADVINGYPPVKIINHQDGSVNVKYGNGTTLTYLHLKPINTDESDK